jgi:predicted AlkP superfamily pyrophosphatase or phosphodiesterase
MQPSRSPLQENVMAAARYGAYGHQRIVVVMLDGLGSDYYVRSPMPTLKAWAASGVFATVQGVMPSVTNANLRRFAAAPGRRSMA